MLEIGFDLINDINIGPNEEFDWEGKSTSLYCIVAGNVSEDLRTLYQVLSHLSKFYQGIFYVPGLLEYKTALDHETRTKEIAALIKKLPKVAFLYHHVVIIDGIAILGANGWSADKLDDIDARLIKSRLEDIAYLGDSVSKLQRHLDVKRILLITACIPEKDLYFGQLPKHVDDHIYPGYCLSNDTEMKITHWAFGCNEQTVDTVVKGVKYVSNPYKKNSVYWPKRINITL